MCEERRSIYCPAESLKLSLTDLKEFFCSKSAILAALLVVCDTAHIVILFILFWSISIRKAKFMSRFCKQEALPKLASSQSDLSSDKEACCRDREAGLQLVRKRQLLL